MAEWPPWHRVQILGSPTSWLFCCVLPGRPPTSLCYFFVSLWRKQGSPEVSLSPKLADPSAYPQRSCSLWGSWQHAYLPEQLGRLKER